MEEDDDERTGLEDRRIREVLCVDESVSSTSNDRFKVGLVMPDVSFSVLLTREPEGRTG